MCFCFRFTTAAAAMPSPFPLLTFNYLPSVNCLLYDFFTWTPSFLVFAKCIPSYPLTRPLNIKWQSCLCACTGVYACVGDYVWYVFFFWLKTKATTKTFLLRIEIAQRIPWSNWIKHFHFVFNILCIIIVAIYLYVCVLRASCVHVCVCVRSTKRKLKWHKTLKLPKCIPTKNTNTHTHIDTPKTTKIYCSCS